MSFPQRAPTRPPVQSGTSRSESSVVIRPADAPVYRAPAIVMGGRSSAPSSPTSPSGNWPDPMWDEPARPAERPVDEPIVDFAQLRQLVGFPWRAVKRRRQLAGGVAAAVMATAALTVLIAPRQYDVETSILAQRNFVMPALGNPRRSVPAESDAPTHMASEAVLNRKSLLSIIDEVGLEQAWPRLRSPVGRTKDALNALARRPLPATERRERLVDYLRGQLWVSADEATVHIGVHFPDPQLALHIVQVAQRNFLRDRNASEQTLIRESIAILETHVASAHDDIDSALTDVRKFAPAPRPAAQAGPRGSAVGGAPSRRATRPPAVASVEHELSAARASIAEAEAARATRIDAAQARLGELQKTLGSAHPDVVSAAAALHALRADTAELARLRAAERDAAARVVTAGGSSANVTAARSAAHATPTAEATLASVALARLATQQAPDTIEDPKLTYARSRLKMAVANYEDLLGRLEGARIELETAGAAFKYRYSIITPAQLPTRLAKPNVVLVCVGGVFAAVLLGGFAALVMDVGSGRIVEGWQVSRFVGLPVIGETPPT